MSNRFRVDQLLEEALVSNRTPEEVCSDCPELTADVREQWQRFRGFEVELAALFPPSATPLRARGGRPPHKWAELPRIPGYAVEAILGRGGVGVVYRARHLRLDRTVAVKMLLSGAHAGRLELARFLREARAVAGLRHPNVVQVFDVGEFEGRPFFTMELIDGGNLAERLAGAPQPPAHAAATVATLSDAVEAAHRHGIVHRDLKPANVLLTVDGTPKITDFGLARRVDGEQSLTLVDGPIGTPSYMAPEQASGGAGAVGPAADIYALGAILYEMLSGRPPFRGGSAAETHRLVLTEDPSAPAPPGGRVPRDLQTICLKCLCKDPGDRYPTAAALADDLRRFGRGEPVAARPTPLPTVVAKWVRRHPSATAAALATAAAIVVAIGCGSWVVSTRTAVERVVAQDVREAIACQRQSAWPQANAALERATGRLGDGGSAELRQQLDQARRDSAMVARLDQIRLVHAATYQGDGRDNARFAADYATAFHAWGMAEPTDAPAAVAARIRASNVRSALVAAVDEWAFWGRKTPRQGWLWTLGRQADLDPTGWRDRAYDPATWRSATAMASLARTAPFNDRSVALLLTVGQQLRQGHQDVIPYLLALDRAHPNDLWTNIATGEAMLFRRDWPEAIRYFQAAIASRPDAAIGHHDLGYTMLVSGRVDDAVAELREAVRLDPLAPHSHGYLGLALYRTGAVDAAIAQVREAIQLWPMDAYFQAMMGGVLARSGRDAEATPELRRAVFLDTRNESVHRALRDCLVRQRRWAEAYDAWKAELELSPTDHDAWYGYAELCLFLGHDDDYRSACAQLLSRFGDSADPNVCERVGRACLLSPACDDNQLRRATAAIDRALASERATPRGWLSYFQLAKALADYRAGRFAEATALVEGPAAQVPNFVPGLIDAMAQFHLGHPDLARAILAKTTAALDKAVPSKGERDVWMIQVLRRQAEDMVARPAR